MTVIAASVAALQLLHDYRCSHCGKKQRRMAPDQGQFLTCINCLKEFSAEQCLVDRHKKRR